MCELNSLCTVTSSMVLNLWAENKPDQHSVHRPPSYLLFLQYFYLWDQTWDRGHVGHAHAHNEEKHNRFHNDFCHKFFQPFRQLHTHPQWGWGSSHWLQFFLPRFAGWLLTLMNSAASLKLVNTVCSNWNLTVSDWYFSLSIEFDKLPHTEDWEELINMNNTKLSSLLFKTDGLAGCWELSSNWHHFTFNSSWGV